MCLPTILRWCTELRYMPILPFTIHRLDITPQERPFRSALAWPWGPCGVAAGVVIPDGETTISKSTTSTISIVTPTSTATSMQIAVEPGTIIRNTAAARPIGTRRPRIVMAGRRAENLCPTGRPVRDNRLANEVETWPAIATPARATGAPTVMHARATGVPTVTHV